MDIKSSLMDCAYPEPNTGCWIWGRYVAKTGYGEFWHPIKKRKVSAHRASYEIFKGPVDGLCVLHTCDVRCCVNPDHLFLGTYKDNVSDMYMKNRQVIARGSMKANSKITEEIAVKIKKAYCSGAGLQKEVAEMFGVSLSIVKQIISGKLWSHANGISDIKRPHGRFPFGRLSKVK